MDQPAFIGKHIREFYFGGNWTDVNLKDSLEGLNWQQAGQKLGSLHSIAELIYHINYFVRVLNRVLQGNPLVGNDAESFNCPAINNERDWENLKNRTWEEAEQFITLVEALPEDRLQQLLGDKKYGSYQRNLFGILEHSHYHLGQIVLLRKLLNTSIS